MQEKKYSYGGSVTLTQMMDYSRVHVSFLTNE